MSSSIYQAGNWCAFSASIQLATAQAKQVFTQSCSNRPKRFVGSLARHWSADVDRVFDKKHDKTNSKFRMKLDAIAMLAVLRMG